MKTLNKFAIHELTDDPKRVSLRHLYTRTEITDTTGWPPSETERVYEDYSKLFIEVYMFLVPHCKVIILTSV